jgi:Na+/melibiose symporter-like transporter
VAAIAIALMVRSVPNSRDETVPRQIDYPGLAAVAIGIAAVTFAVDRGDAWGWGSGRTIGLFAAGAALLLVFVAIERRVSFPLVDLALFRNRRFVAITLLGMTANVAFVVTTFAATLYLQDVRGYSPLAGGAIFLAASVMQAIAGPLSGRLAERFNVSRTMLVAICVGAVGLLVIAAGPATAIIGAALTVFGIGYGLCWAMLSVGTQAVVRKDQAGEASGVSLSIVIGMAGLAVALVASLIEVVASGGTSEGEAIERILRVIAIGSVVLALPLAWLGSRGATRG